MKIEILNSKAAEKFFSSNPNLITKTVADGKIIKVLKRF